MGKLLQWGITQFYFLIFIKHSSKTIMITRVLILVELGIETALNDSNVDYKGSTVYATTYPTAYCAKEMVKKKIKRVVFYNDVRTDFHDNYYASTSSILQEGDVEISFFEAQDDRHPDYTENNDTKAIRLAANLVNLKEYTTYLIRRI
nr:uncharacterized protein LOC111418313 isoform X2 [Onthophagus taurus]